MVIGWNRQLDVTWRIPSSSPSLFLHLPQRLRFLRRQRSTGHGGRNDAKRRREAGLELLGMGWDGPMVQWSIFWGKPTVAPKKLSAVALPTAIFPWKSQQFYSQWSFGHKDEVRNSDQFDLDITISAKARSPASITMCGAVSGFCHGASGSVGKSPGGRSRRPHRAPPGVFCCHLGRWSKPNGLLVVFYYCFSTLKYILSISYIIYIYIYILILIYSSTS